MNKVVQRVINSKFFMPDAARSLWENGDRCVTLTVNRYIDEVIKFPKPRLHPNRPGAFKRPDKMFRHYRKQRIAAKSAW